MYVCKDDRISFPSLILLPCLALINNVIKKLLIFEKLNKYNYKKIKIWWGNEKSTHNIELRPKEEYFTGISS